MQVTFNAEDPLDRVVAAVEAVYGVRLRVEDTGPDGVEDDDVPGGWEATGGKVRQDKT